MIMKVIKDIQVLEAADIRKKCQSFYATEPKGDVSERYGFISTREISKILWGFGWMPTWAEETRSNLVANQGYNRHMVRFSHPEAIMKGTKDRIEIVLVNSHNRSSMVELMVGILPEDHPSIIMENTCFLRRQGILIPFTAGPNGTMFTAI